MRKSDIVLVDGDANKPEVPERLGMPIAPRAQPVE
jgi:hypothetical protein